MIELIWGLLNLFLAIGLIIFCVRKTIEIRQKMGLFVAIVFAFFALSFISRPSKNADDKKFEFQNRKETQKLGRSTFISEIVLEENVVSKINLITVCDEENAVSALITRTGFIGGTDWKTDYISIDKTGRKNIYHYNIDATRIWKILGVEIYFEHKEFQGVKEFKPLM